MQYRSVTVESTRNSSPVAAQAATVLAREVRERGCAEGHPALTVALIVDQCLPPESYAIGDASPHRVEVRAGSEAALFFGAGRFLRDCRFDDSGCTPGAWRGTSSPECAIRGMYFATHFHNFYHDAPIGQVTQYVQELALWGCNALMVWFDMHHYASIDDPAAVSMIERLHTILRAAQDVGMQPGLLYLGNEGYSSTPASVRVTPGPYQYNCEICPSLPGALDEIRRTRGQVLDAFADLDLAFVCVWPHDQGGCGCAACNPWGAQGFVECVRTTAPLVRARFPRAKLIASTWCFDKFLSGEFEGFWGSLARESGLADMVMADSHSGFPPFVLTHPLPGRVSLVNFPEISMMGQTPWGGFGHNPLPQHIERTWGVSKHLLDGGFPYSEGIFEDINKAITLQLYWKRDRSIRDIVEEYAASQWVPDHARELADVVMRIGDAGHIGLGGDGILDNALFASDRVRREQPSQFPGRYYSLPQADFSAANCAALDRALNEAPRWVRESWRWRTFALRVRLESAIRASGGTASPDADRMFGELSRIYCASNAEPPVCPPDSGVVAALVSHARKGV